MTATHQPSTIPRQTFDPSAWPRLEFEGTPVYVRDCDPCWFAPNAAFSLLLDANPLTPEPQQRVMRINIEVARAIAAVRALLPARRLDRADPSGGSIARTTSHPLACRNANSLPADFDE